MGKNSNKIITLTSDWGTRTPYLATMKGQILKLCPDAETVDISHNIPVFDIRQAIFVLKTSYRFFPENTWHIVSIDTIGKAPNPAHVIIRYDDHYFMGYDNGLFTLLFNDTPNEIYEINVPLPKGSLFPARDLYVPVLAQIFNGQPITNFATRKETLCSRTAFLPVVNENRVSGKVVFIDNYGNAFTNIDLSSFEKAKDYQNNKDENKINKDKFTLQAPRGVSVEIRSISTAFNFGQGGETVVFFLNDYLMISICFGSTYELLGLKVDDSINIIF